MSYATPHDLKRACVAGEVSRGAAREAAKKLGLLPGYYGDGAASIRRSGPFPHYPKRFDGRTAFVCGSARTLMSDYAGALKIERSPVVFSINRTGGLIGGDFLVSKDLKQHSRSWWESRIKFSDSPFLYIAPRAMPKNDPCSHIDLWWPAANGDGTSAWCAVRIAAFLGFKRIILCGVPMEKMDYVTGDWGTAWLNWQSIESYREAIKRDDHIHRLVRSMSGWTREFFGAP